MACGSETGSDPDLVVTNVISARHDAFGLMSLGPHFRLIPGPCGSCAANRGSIDGAEALNADSGVAAPGRDDPVDDLADRALAPAVDAI